MCFLRLWLYKRILAWFIIENSSVVIQDDSIKVRINTVEKFFDRIELCRFEEIIDRRYLSFACIRLMFDWIWRVEDNVISSIYDSHAIIRFVDEFVQCFRASQCHRVIYYFCWCRRCRCTRAFVRPERDFVTEFIQTSRTLVRHNACLKEIIRDANEMSDGQTKRKTHMNASMDQVWDALPKTFIWKGIKFKNDRTNLFSRSVHRKYHTWTASRRCEFVHDCAMSIIPWRPVHKLSKCVASHLSDTTNADDKIAEM